MIARMIGRVVLWFFALCIILPLAWTLLNAFKVNADLLTAVPKVFFDPTLDNIAYVLGRDSVFGALWNSLVVCLSAVTLGLVLALQLHSGFDMALPCDGLMGASPVRDLGATPLDLIGDTLQEVCTFVSAGIPK